MKERAQNQTEKKISATKLMNQAKCVCVDMIEQRDTENEKKKKRL